MIVSGHARKRMQDCGVDEEQLRYCLREGKLVAKQVVRGEMRYSKEVELKFMKIIVVYCINKDGEERIITCYPIRKKW